LYETGRQLVVTCDRLPHQLFAIEERLRERFESGLVADIQPPDFATRVAILRKRAALDQIPLADQAVLDLVADRVTDNVRSLEGALIRIVAFHSLTGRVIDEHLATEVLDDISPRGAQRHPPSLAHVQSTVAAHYEISVAELVSANRAAPTVWPRQVAIYLARALTGASLNEIGKAFGGRAHATIMHACKRVSDRVKDDQEAADVVKALRDLIVSDRGC
jgi:chromosomal replication initiator protein